VSPGQRKKKTSSFSPSRSGTPGRVGSKAELLGRLGGLWSGKLLTPFSVLFFSFSILFLFWVLIEFEFCFAGFEFGDC
jgi:hypothetical protein